MWRRIDMPYRFGKPLRIFIDEVASLSREPVVMPAKNAYGRWRFCVQAFHDHIGNASARPELCAAAQHVRSWVRIGDSISPQWYLLRSTASRLTALPVALLSQPGRPRA